MDIRVRTERLDNCQVNVIIEVDASQIDQQLRQAARKISRQFTVPGYRRGRAPFHAVVRVFGRDAIQQEALDEFGQDLYEKALEEIEYEPYQPGELQDVEWDPFRMTVLLPIPPEVDLGDYRAVRVAYEPEPVTDEAIEVYLAGVQREHSQWVPVERPAVLGDQVVVDAVGKMGGETVLSNENYEMVLDVDATLPVAGFHEQIVGMSPGEDRVFGLTYPDDDPQEDVAGREATFTVHLHTVKQEEVPPLDDEFAQMLGDYDTLADLKASIREQLEAEALEKTESEYLDKVLEAMIDAALKIEYPPAAVDHEAELALERMERNLASSGIEMDRFLAMVGKTREGYKLEIRPSAEQRLKKRLVLIELAKREGIEVEDAEIESQIERLSEQMGEQAAEMREVLESPGGRLSIADDLILDKVQMRAIQIGKGEAPPLEAETEPEQELEADEATEPGAEPGTGGDLDAEQTAQMEPLADPGEAGNADSGDDDVDGGESE